MVMPNNIGGTPTVGQLVSVMREESRRSFWVNAFLYAIQSGRNAEAAAVDADRALAALDARDITPAKITFGLKEQA